LTGRNKQNLRDLWDNKRSNTCIFGSMEGKGKGGEVERILKETQLSFCICGALIPEPTVDTKIHVCSRPLYKMV
jgi:hypothetical protein